jgi:hypothetical protein
MTLQRQRITIEPSPHCPCLFPLLLVYKAIELMSCCLQLTPSPWSLTISSPYLFWQKQQKCRLQIEQQCKILRNSENSPKHLWPTMSRVDPGLKDRVLNGAQQRPRCHSLQRHPAWPVVKSSHMTTNIYIALEPQNLTMCCDLRTCPTTSYLCFGSFPRLNLCCSDFALKAGEDQYL